MVSVICWVHSGPPHYLEKLLLSNLIFPQPPSQPYCSSPKSCTRIPPPSLWISVWMVMDPLDSAKSPTFCGVPRAGPDLVRETRDFVTDSVPNEGDEVYRQVFAWMGFCCIRVCSARSWSGSGWAASSGRTAPLPDNSASPLLATAGIFPHFFEHVPAFWKFCCGLGGMDIRALWMVSAGCCSQRAVVVSNNPRKACRLRAHVTTDVTTGARHDGGTTPTGARHDGGTTALGDLSLPPDRRNDPG